MAQPPFLVDQVQIEPGESGTRLINRDPVTGGLLFQDPFVTVLLSDMAGIRNITGVYIVGRGGGGSAYSSIQDAIDAVPNSSSITEPSLVLIYPGVYQENLSVQKDGLCLFGMGYVKIVNDGSEDTISITASTEVTPKSVILKNLNIENTVVSKACVRIDGGDTFATGSITVATMPLVAGDTLTIGGHTLTGVSTTRTPGNNDFSVQFSTQAAQAAEIAAAINDVDNAFYDIVLATSDGSEVPLTAKVAGVVGNAIGLESSTGRLTLSGATLTGGTAEGSLVAQQGIVFEGCNFIATGVGNYQLVADTCNHVEINGGTFKDSDSASSIQISNCALFRASNVNVLKGLEFFYDSTYARPSDTDSQYQIQSCPSVGDIISNIFGTGALDISNCATVGDITAGGDMTLRVKGSCIGSLSLSDTIAATLILSPRGEATVASGDPTLQESEWEGTLEFDSATTGEVTFEVPQPDIVYKVFLDVPTVLVTAGVAPRSETGFTVETTVPCTGTIGFIVCRTLR